LTEKRSNLIVVDSDLLFREYLSDSLSHEFDLTFIDKGKEVLKKIKKSPPHLLLISESLPDMSGEALCCKLKSDKSLSAIPAIVLIDRDESNGREKKVHESADYYVAKPVYIPELVAKIKSCLRAKSLYTNFHKKDLLNVLDIYESLTTLHSSSDILSDIANKVASSLDAVRCSIVQIDEKENSGNIIASNDDVQTKGVSIDLAIYPEVRRAIELKRDVIINDIQSDPVMKASGKHLNELPFHSLAVIPISIRDKFIGTLLLRVATEKERISEKEISFCQVVARAAENVLENARLVDSLRVANMELEKLATTDGLTGLFNHRYFYNRLEEEYNISLRYHVSLSCIMLDIDFFKKINDTYGHRKGDTILKELARVILRTIRKTDVAARYGGEEFVILLPHTEEKGAMFQAERIRTSVKKSKYSALPAKEPLTISLGITTCNQEDISRAEDLVKFADKALYEAKKRGRNQSVMWGGFEP